MASCLTRRQAILTAFTTNRWILSAGHRPTLLPLSSFSRQHSILTTPAVRSFSSEEVSYDSFLGMILVPHGTVLVIERFGTHRKILSEVGPHFVIPFLDRIAFAHYVGDRTIQLQQSAVTKDNIRILVDVILRVKTVDVMLASYNVPYADHILATNKIATIALRRSVSMLTYDNIISERQKFTNAILSFWHRFVVSKYTAQKAHDLAKKTRDEST